MANVAADYSAQGLPAQVAAQVPGGLEEASDRLFTFTRLIRYPQPAGDTITVFPTTFQTAPVTAMILSQR